MRRFLLRPRLLALLGVALCAAPRAWACPACFGGGDGSAVVDGMNAAILVMLGILGTVFAGIIAFIFWMRRRSRVLFDRTAGRERVRGNRAGGRGYSRDPSSRSSPSFIGRPPP